MENDESQDQLVQSISKRNQAQNDVTKADTQQLDSTNNLKRTKPKYSEVLHRKDSLEDKDVQTSEHLDIDNSQFIDLPPIEETQNHSDEEQENVDINQMKKGKGIKFFIFINLILLKLFAFYQKYFLLFSFNFILITKSSFFYRQS